MLSGRSKIEPPHITLFYLYELSGKAKSVQTERAYYWLGIQRSVLKLDCGDLCTVVLILMQIELCT